MDDLEAAWLKIAELSAERDRLLVKLEQAFKDGWSTCWGSCIGDPPSESRQEEREQKAKEYAGRASTD